MPVKQKRPPKTKLEKRFLKELPEAPSATEALRRAGYEPKSVSSATSMAHELMTKLDMSYWFYESGLTRETIAQNTARIALTAKKIHGTNDNFIEVEDNPTQLNAMKFATDLMGLTKSVGDTNVTIVQPIYASKAE